MPSKYLYDSHSKALDQSGGSMEAPPNPQRIVSLVPSQTELLFDLGLDERVIGVTKFCVHPREKYRSKVRIGGTKNLNIDKIKELNPDLILANKEENTREEIELLAAHFPVWVSNVRDLDDAYSMIKSIGSMTGTKSKAEEIITQIKNAFKKLVQIPPLKVLYLIWDNPFMVAGDDTFINTMIKSTGMVNVIQDPRYPEIKNLDSHDAEVIMLSSEPYPFREKHKKELRKKYPTIKFVLVDGEMFSWYGSRLRFFPDYFNSIAKDLRSSQK